VVVLHAYDEASSADAASAALAHAVAAGRNARGVALFGGLARVGWTVAHVVDPTTDPLCVAIDREVLAALGSLAEWDLVSGFVGIGVYALERGEAARELASRVLDELERLARPRGRGLAWHTPPEAIPLEQRTDAPHGYWNLGLAHGTPGVIALLARYVAAGIDRARAARLLDAAVEFLIDAEPVEPRGRYPTWHAEGGTAPSTARARLAWCYGDLGVAVALLAAATARGHTPWRDEALELARACARRPDTGARELGICHGAAGVAHLFNRLYQATGEPELGDAARAWLSRALAMRASVDTTTDATLLTGSTGVALVLLAAATELEPSWDRMLLVDLPLV
jgi:hypothetical protein